MSEISQDGNHDTSSTGKSDTDKLQLCYDIINNAYKFTFENRTNLDEKASKIIIFSGIIMSVYSGIGGIFLRDISQTEVININKYNLLLTILFLGVLSLIISIILALIAYKPEIWQNVPSAKAFHEKYVKEDADKEIILSKLASTTVKAIQDNEMKMNNKAKNIRRSYWALVIGIILCTGFIFFAIIV